MSTHSSSTFYYVPVDIIVCGAEEVIQTSPADFNMTFELDRDIKYYDIAGVNSKLASTESRCPISVYEVVDEFKDAYFETYVKVYSSTKL